MPKSLKIKDIKMFNEVFFTDKIGKNLRYSYN